jgi:uncharacterized protein
MRSPVLKNISGLSLVGVLFLLLVAIPAAAIDLQPIPDLRQRVTDEVQLLGEQERQMLESKLAQFEERKGSQIALLLVGSTQPETIEQYGIRVAEVWKLGRDGVDDGILLLVAVQDRKLRIEVGYGLEGAVTDAYSKRIIEQIIKPSFQQGQFYLGLDQGVDALIALVDGEDLPERTVARAPEGPEIGAWRILLPIFLLFGAVGIDRTLSRSVGKAGSRAALFTGTFGIGWVLVSFLFGLIVALITLFILVKPTGGGGGHYRGGPFFQEVLAGGEAALAVASEAASAEVLAAAGEASAAVAHRVDGNQLQYVTRNSFYGGRTAGDQDCCWKF